MLQQRAVGRVQAAAVAQAVLGGLPARGALEAGEDVAQGLCGDARVVRGVRAAAREVAVALAHGEVVAGKVARAPRGARRARRRVLLARLQQRLARQPRVPPAAGLSAKGGEGRGGSG